VSLDQANPNRVVLRTLPAILACFRDHPKALRELRATREAAKALQEVAAWMGAQGLPATVVGSKEVRELAEADAPAAAVTARPVLGLAKLSDFAEWREAGDTVVIADGFDDPADLASVVRAMAAFGSRRLLLAGSSERLAFEPELWDGARGALEAVRLIRAPALGGLLKLIEPTSVVIGFSPKLGRSLAEAAPIRAPGRGNVVLLSPQGVDADLQPKVEHLIRLPAGKGDHALSAGDSAALILHWLSASGPAKPKEGTGFLARKRARKA
jgi:tRNA G18 (ribose-2'-O)-methylase SpoU